MNNAIPFYVSVPDKGCESVCRWDGKIYPIKMETQPYEISMQIRGLSYHLIFGEQLNGWFLCIPEWGIGAELGDPADMFWNTGSLIRAGTDNATTACIVNALRVINSYI